MHMKKPKRFDFDLIVIGSGAGGGLAAHLAAQEGKKVALIESHALGGENLVSNSIPTKALLKTAETLSVIQESSFYGIKTSNATYNYQRILAWQEKAMANAGLNNEMHMFKSEGISVIKGHAHFISPWVVNVAQHRYCAKNFIIATGSSPMIPLIPGLSESGYITYRQAARLPSLPKNLLIIGGGAISYEYANIYSSFGVKIHLIEKCDHLLPYADAEVSDCAELSLSAKGVKVSTEAQVINVTTSHGRKLVTYQQYDREYRVVVDEIMVATGKIPNIDIGIENTGLHCSKNGIQVNRFMQTNRKHIYAVGDVAGQYKTLHSHAAIQEARVATHNLYHRNKITMDYSAIPTCVFGIPEIAIVGKSERELILSGDLYQTAIAPISVVGRAITNNYTTGFVKLVASHSGVLLGASIVSPCASEILQELTLAIRHHMHACEISKTVHPFPTWSEAIRVAADKIQCS